MTDPKLDLPVIYTHVIYTLKHTRYIHTETHTWNTLTRTKKALWHTVYKSLYTEHGDTKIFKSIIIIYSNTQHQTPDLLDI